MLEPQRILVATDFSPSAQCGVGAAAALASRFRAELTVLHVVEESAYAYPFRVPPGSRDEAKAGLEATVASLRGRVERVAGVLREGFAAHEIAAASEATGADLVVVGAQGLSGLPRLVHGSVAERVVRLSKVPVLTVHRSDELPTLSQGEAPFRRVLVATDFGTASGVGVEKAIDLAVGLDAKLTVVHVCELPLRSYVTADVATEVENRARREFDAVLAGIRRKLPGAEGVLRRGNAWAEILAAAGEIRADLVVLSTHGRQGLAGAFVGSVAEKVVRMASAPVLTVPAR